jgi:hypothetical protein
MFTYVNKNAWKKVPRKVLEQSLLEQKIAGHVFNVLYESQTKKQRQENGL